MNIDINGMCPRSDDVLLFADCGNRTVKSLLVSTNELAIVFREPLLDWCVCNAFECHDRDGMLLVVTEKMPGGVEETDTRVCIARLKTGIYNTVATFPLERTKVRE